MKTSLAAVIVLSNAVISNSFSLSPCCSFSKSPSLSPPSSQMKRRNKYYDVNGTSLNALLEVPPFFFTFTFASLGILVSVSREFSRFRLEESAWEQRLEEARLNRLRDDPSLSLNELELRKKEAELEWSAYGKPRKEDRERTLREKEDRSLGDKNNMKDDEINQFEMEYGVEYDPYYDDPYAEDELPKGNFKTDNKYGDRVYDNGEIFYKDKASGLFYRQGAKPRNLSFW